MAYKWNIDFHWALDMFDTHMKNQMFLAQKEVICVTYLS